MPRERSFACRYIGIRTTFEHPNPWNVSKKAPETVVVLLLLAESSRKAKSLHLCRRYGEKAEGVVEKFFEQVEGKAHRTRNLGLYGGFDHEESGKLESLLSLRVGNPAQLQWNRQGHGSFPSSRVKLHLSNPAHELRRCGLVCFVLPIQRRALAIGMKSARVAGGASRPPVGA